MKGAVIAVGATFVVVATAIAAAREYPEYSSKLCRDGGPLDRRPLNPESP